MIAKEPKGVETPDAAISPGPASPRVFARERRQAIGRFVEEQGRAWVADLAAGFDVSEVTIRKDLLRLEQEHRVIRTHGGAIAAGHDRAEQAFEVRQRLQREEKAAIGAAAAHLVRDGESIALDASTTALQVARHLRDHGEWHSLTVVTNGLRIAAELAGLPGVTVLMPGGRMRPEAMSLVGSWGESLLRRANIQKAFVGALGFTLEEGLTDATEEEAELKRAMVAAARQVIAVVDHTKWGLVAFATFCRAERIGLLVTDAAAPPEMVEQMRQLGGQVLQVGPEPGTGRPAPSTGEAGVRPAR